MLIWTQSLIWPALAFERVWIFVGAQRLSYTRSSVSLTVSVTTRVWRISLRRQSRWRTANHLSRGGCSPDAGRRGRDPGKPQPNHCANNPSLSERGIGLALTVYEYAVGSPRHSCLAQSHRRWPTLRDLGADLQRREPLAACLVGSVPAIREPQHWHTAACQTLVARAVACMRISNTCLNSRARCRGTTLLRPMQLGTAQIPSAFIAL